MNVAKKFYHSYLCVKPAHVFLLFHISWLHTMLSIPRLLPFCMLVSVVITRRGYWMVRLLQHGQRCELSSAFSQSRKLCKFFQQKVTFPVYTLVPLCLISLVSQTLPKIRTVRLSISIKLECLHFIAVFCEVLAYPLIFAGFSAWYRHWNAVTSKKKKKSISCYWYYCFLNIGYCISVNQLLY